MCVCGDCDRNKNYFNRYKVSYKLVNPLETVWSMISCLEYLCLISISIWLSFWCIVWAARSVYLSFVHTQNSLHGSLNGKHVLSCVYKIDPIGMFGPYSCRVQWTLTSSLSNQQKKTFWEKILATTIFDSIETILGLFRSSRFGSESEFTPHGG